MSVSREFYAGLGMRDSERYDGEMVNRWIESKKAQRQPAFAQGYGGRAGTEAQSKKDNQATYQKQNSTLIPSQFIKPSCQDSIPELF